jgi:hypothetical protein
VRGTLTEAAEQHTAALHIWSVPEGARTWCRQGRSCHSSAPFGELADGGRTRALEAGCARGLVGAGVLTVGLELRAGHRPWLMERPGEGLGRRLRATLVEV